MTIIYIQNWASTTVGALPAGWAGGGASSSGWGVVNSATAPAFIPSPNTKGLKGPGVNNAWCIYSGQATPTDDMEIRFDFGNDDSVSMPVLRSDAAGQNFYWFQIIAGTYIDFRKVVGGADSRINFFNTGSAPFSVGAGGSFRAQIVGNTIKLRWWPLGTTEPGTWNLTLTDSSITTGKYSGVAFDNPASSANAVLGTFSLDDLQVTAGISVSPTSVLPGSTTTLTLTGTNVTWTQGTPGSPSFTVSAGTKNSQTVGSSTSATLNYTAGVAGSVTITDPGSGATCMLTIATATDFTISPSTQTTSPSVATGNYSVALNGGLTATETFALSDGGHGGTFTPSSLTFLSTDPLSKNFAYTPSGSASGTITLTATATGQFSTNHSASCVIAAAITPGQAFATYVGATIVNLSASNASGGSGSFTYQWYRSTTSGSIGSALSGSGTEAFIDTTPAANTDYYYTMQYTDTGSSVTANSAQIHVKTLSTSSEVIGGVGDSIMGRAATGGETPFTSMISQLNYKFAGSKQFIGVDRSISGTTSGDWVSGGSDLPAAVAAFASAGVTRVVLMLGTNDSAAGTATSQATYQANIQGAITYMFANISTLKTVHLFSSPFQSLTSGNLSIQNCARIVSYSAALAAIANGTTIFYSAPLESYNFFQKYPDQLSDGIHPGDQGVGSFGGLWSSNVATDITPSGGGAGPHAPGFTGGFQP